MSDAFDLLAEARWEMEGTRRAARRYREAAAATDPSSLPSGQKLLREVVPPLIREIKKLQEAGLVALGVAAKEARWAIPIQLLDADVLAVITVIRGMNAARGQGDTVSSIPAVARDIAASVRDELNYRQWVSEQVAANSAAKEAEDWTHRDLLRAFKARYPQADRKTWRRWAKKIDAVQSAPFQEETAVQLGAALIKALVDAAPTRFELGISGTGTAKTQNYLKLSPETLALMSDIEARAEVARPRLMPMIIPPIPWRYE